MKMSLLILVCLFVYLNTWAQVPEAFRYQSIVRDGNGDVVVNQPVSFQVSLISGSVTGTVMYVETHAATTNSFGLVSLAIGEGTLVSGSFAGIDWASAAHFIKVEVDITGGTSYVDMGTTQLLSVPYALNSKTSEDAFSGNYSDLTGTPTDVSTFNNDAGYITNPDDADADPANEIQTLSIAGNNLTISGANTVAIPQTTYTAGSGINVTGTTITNTAPDQTMSITGSGATNVTGTYPNYTISSTDNNTTYSAGSGLSLTGTTFANTTPDQTVALTGSGATNVTGTYPNFTISSTDNNSGGTVTSIATGNGITGGTITTTGTLGLTGQALSLHNLSTSGLIVRTGTGSVITRSLSAGTGITISNADGSAGNPSIAANIGTTSTTVSAGNHTHSLYGAAGTTGQIQFNDAGAFGASNELYWDNTNARMGVGLSNPNGRMVVQGSSTALVTDPLFEVKDDAGYTVFVVYKDSARFYFDDDAAKTNKGTFAVSGRNTAKAFTHNYFIVRPDSTRIYTGDSLTGFGVENISSTSQSYMNMTPANYFIGHEAGKNITSGRYNSFIGYKAGYSDTSGNSNYFIGYYSGYSNRSGYSNVFLGDNSGYNNTTGYGNIFLGDHCGYNNTTGVRNVFLGYYSGYSNNGNYNVFLGDHAGFSNTSGWGNTANGYYALYSNTTGINNVANGYQALYFNVTGNYNVANGYTALYFNDNGSYNVANGYQALYMNTTGGNNVAIGNQALFSNTIGVDNTAAGNKALLNNIDGDRNVAFGLQTLNNNTGGGQNVANGYMALYSNTTGNNNVAVGYGTLFANQTGGNNTALGNNCFTTGTAYTNSTCLGANSAMTQSNKVRLGNATVTVIEGQVAYTFPSDGRFKNNVTEEVKGLDFINRLRPIVYNFDTKKFDKFLMQDMTDSMRNVIMNNNDYGQSTNIRQSGFIAQEVEQAARESGYDFNGVHKPESDKDNYSVAYSLFTVPIVKAIQELSAENTELKNINILLNDRIEKLNEEIQSMRSDIERIKEYQTDNK